MDFITRQELVRRARSRGMVLQGDAAHPEYLSFDQGNARCYWSTGFENPDRFGELRRWWRAVIDSVGLRWPLYVTEVHKSIVQCSDPAAAALLQAMNLPDDESLVAVVPESQRAVAPVLLSAVVESVENAGLEAMVFSAEFDRFLMIDHHDCVWAFFPNEREKAAAVSAMERSGFSLPLDPPDWTFKFGPDGTPIENANDSPKREQ